MLVQVITSNREVAKMKLKYLMEEWVKPLALGAFIAIVFVLIFFAGLGLL